MSLKSVMLEEIARNPGQSRAALAAKMVALRPGLDEAVALEYLDRWIEARHVAVDDDAHVRGPGPVPPPTREEP